MFSFSAIKRKKDLILQKGKTSINIKLEYAYPVHPLEEDHRHQCC